MMQSNDYSNYGPRTARRSSMSSSTSATRVRRVSLTLSMEDGSCHDLTNLSLKANVRPQTELFPSREYVRRLPDIHDRHTWRPLPQTQRVAAPFQRSHTTTTCTLKEDERVTRGSYCSRSKVPMRRSTICMEDEPLSSLPVRRQEVRRQDRPFTSYSERLPVPAPYVPAPYVPAPPAPTTIPSTRPAEPGPRPKVNYKKIFSSGAGEEEEEGYEQEMGHSKRDLSLRGSQRHISFQEQQLQRTLQEEERLKKEEQGVGKNSPYQEPEEPSPRPPDMQDNSQWQWQEPALPPLAPMQQQQQQYQENPRQQQQQYGQYQEPACQYHQSYTPSPPAPQAQHRSYTPAPQAHYAPQARAQTRSPPASSGGSQTVMEIAPNLFVPYKGSHETWEAVQRGQFTVTTCFACTLQLVVIDTAEFLVCPDCHTVSPLSYSGDAHVERCGVGLGIKREWCDTEAALPTNGMYQQQSSVVFAPPSTPLQPYPATSPPVQQQQQQQQRQSRPTYEQRHQDKQAKYIERSPSPEQEDRSSNSQRRSTLMI